MPDSVVIFLGISSVLFGLWAGWVAWSFWISFVLHRPNCPYKDEVITRARQVRLDVEELMRGGY